MTLKVFKMHIFSSILLKEKQIHALNSKYGVILYLYRYCWHFINYVWVHTKINTRKSLASAFFNPEGTLQHVFKMHLFSSILCKTNILYLTTCSVLCLQASKNTWFSKIQNSLKDVANVTKKDGASVQKKDGKEMVRKDSTTKEWKLSNYCNIIL